MRTTSIIPVLCLVVSSGLALAKRAAPATIEPVIHLGIRYETQVDRDERHNAGYVTATRVSDKKVLWKAQVYRTTINPKLETDVQDVYFRSMVLAPSKDALLLENEDDKCFSVTLSSHAVTQVSCKPSKR